jgi:hypothetical protein
MAAGGGAAAVTLACHDSGRQRPRQRPTASEGFDDSGRPPCPQSAEGQLLGAPSLYFYFPQRLEGRETAAGDRDSEVLVGYLGERCRAALGIPYSVPCPGV